MKIITRFIFTGTMLILLLSCGRGSGELDLTYVSPEGVGDIYQFEDSLIKPVDYLNLISLDQLPVSDRKKIFIRQMLPTILVCKYNLEVQKDFITKIAAHDTTKLTRRQRRSLDSLYTRYKTRNINELIIRLHTHPVSIVLAQAALESAWGTSRFYSEGNNVFGIWSFSDSDTRIPSQGKRNGESVYLKKYRTLSESVEDYFLVLGRGPFSDFRRKRMVSNDPFELVNLLTNYSESEKEYAQLLRLIITTNNLTQYDNYRIDPEFIR